MQKMYEILDFSCRNLSAERKTGGVKLEHLQGVLISRC